MGSRSLCSYCGETREALTLGDLADRVHAALQEHFEPISSEADTLWQGSGHPVTDWITDIAGLSEKIAGDLTGMLSDRYSYLAATDGEDNPYADDVEYEERRSYYWDFREVWEAFRSELESSARFFSVYAEEALSTIFGDLTGHRASENKPAILEIRPKDDGFAIWRARKARSTKELKAILNSLW